MRCSGCGKEVPFGGQVCPYCLRDKSSDQTTHVGMGCGLLVGGSIGYTVYGVTGAVIGGIALVIVGAIIAAIAGGPSQPPKVQVVDSLGKPRKPTPTPPATDDDIAARLKRLDDLRLQGLLSDDEHKAQRAKIIGTI